MKSFQHFQVPKAAGGLYRGFSVHDKGKAYETFNL